MSIASTSATFAGSANDEAPVTLVQLAERFGDIPATRICLDPSPGTATEEDVIRFQEQHDRLFELVDGTLIEKDMGIYESHIAGTIHGLLFAYLRKHSIGVSIPADGLFRLRAATVRLPDVAYIANSRLQNAKLREEKIANISPNLAIEVISAGNSRKEMEDKLTEYFDSGSEEVWYVYPKKRELHQFFAPQAQQIWQGSTTITTPLLPGFELKLAELFESPFAPPSVEEPRT
jgi:Uma2 family endonuclease